MKGSIVATEIPPVDWNTRDTAKFVDAVQAYYVRTAGNATPRKILPLLDFLDAVADQAEEKIGDTFKPIKIGTLETDLAGWRLRSAAYRSALESADPDDGRAIAESVIGPLLLGWYAGRASQTVLDAATPITIAHGADVTAAAFSDAWDRLEDNLADDTAAAAKGAAAAVADVAAAAAAAAAAAKDAAGWLSDPDHRLRLAIIPAGIALTVAGVLAVTWGMRR